MLEIDHFQIGINTFLNNDSKPDRIISQAGSY